uniref:Uncharacterized protein n=1 Tax=Oryza meridionalis TaxID=40149 RepID=A0A0E0ER86_9ORYZ
MPSGVVTLLRALLRYPSSLGKELWVKSQFFGWMTAASFGVVTLVGACQPILATAGLLPAIPATLAAADQVVLLQLPVL